MNQTIWLIGVWKIPRTNNHNKPTSQSTPGPKKGDSLEAGLKSNSPHTFNLGKPFHQSMKTRNIPTIK